MDIILAIHSINRWLIVIAAVVALIKFAVGWLGKQEYKRADQVIMNMYTGFLDLQVLLGIILIIGLEGGLLRYRVEHAVMMIAAVILAHISRRWHDAANTVKFRNNFIVIGLGIILIIAGVFALPIGWTLSISSP